MQFEINTKQAGLDDDSSRRAERLLRFSLSRFSGSVSRVRVSFSDVNGPKGGLDKRCRITAKMRAAGQVVVQKDGHDYAEALFLCLDKLSRTIRREVDRRRTLPIRKNRIYSYCHVENLWPLRQPGHAGMYQDEV